MKAGTATPIAIGTCKFEGSHAVNVAKPKGIDGGGDSGGAPGGGGGTDGLGGGGGNTVRSRNGFGLRSCEQPLVFHANERPINPGSGGVLRAF